MKNNNFNLKKMMAILDLHNEEMAKILGVSVRMVQVYIKSGKIPFIRKKILESKYPEYFKNEFFSQKTASTETGDSSIDLNKVIKRYDRLLSFLEDENKHLKKLLKSNNSEKAQNY